MSQSGGFVFLAALLWWWFVGWPLDSNSLDESCGTEADITSLPYMASIQWLESGRHDCSAVIISREWVLTHYKCKSILSPTGYYVHVGSSTAERVTTHQVVEWIQQPTEGKHFNEDKLSLLKVKPPFVFNKKVAPAALPAQHQQTINGEVGVFSEWEEKNGGYRLHSVKLNLISDAQCKKKRMLKDDEHFVCGSLAKGEVPLCAEQHGAPLVVDGTVLGISVLGEGCRFAHDVQQFAQVSSARNWIQYTTGV